MTTFFDMVLFHYALSFCGKPYIWGGDDPIIGYDCSGYVLELMYSAGQVPRDVDMTAQQLFNYFEKGRAVYSTAPKFGSLVFYGKSVTRIKHVAFALDGYRVIEAGGGDRNVKTAEDAAVRNACVRVRPVDHRNDRVAVLKPFYNSIGRMSDAN
jgi:cell wall-associated NlpC family hydrolase